MYFDGHYNPSLLLFPIAPRTEIKRINDIEHKKLLASNNELNSLEKCSSNYWHWRIKNGRIYFWECVDGKQCGITKDFERIHMLARRDYLRLRLSDKKYDSYNDWCLQVENLLSIYFKLGLDIRRIVLTQNQYTWARFPQSQNDYYADQLKYKTNGGVAVRSKSEQIIGNILEEFCIPFRYEPEIRIGNRVFHPDFVIMTEDGRKIIIEHLGRMDLRNYIQANIDKLSAYSSAGYTIGENLFLSFESNISDRETLLKFIYKVLSV